MLLRRRLALGVGHTIAATRHFAWHWSFSSRQTSAEPQVGNSFSSASHLVSIWAHAAIQRDEAGKRSLLDRVS